MHSIKSFSAGMNVERRDFDGERILESAARGGKRRPDRTFMEG